MTKPPIKSATIPPMTHEFKSSQIAGTDIVAAIKAMEKTGYRTMLVVLGKIEEDGQGNERDAFRTMFYANMTEKDRLLILKVALEASEQFEKGLEGMAKKERSKFGID